MKLTSLRAALAGAALVACGLLAVPTAASAAPPSVPPGIDQRSVPAEEVAAAASYWTAERMLAAIPGDVLLAGRSASTPAAEVAAGAPVTYGKPSTGDGTIEPMAASEAPVSNIGKVFFTLNGRNYVCSGNSVSAVNSSLVSTAAHCVHAGKGKYATNWVFVPAYQNGSAPYGQWAATKLTAPTQWTKGGDISYDTAFAKVAPLGGRTLAQVVGATSVAFNQARGLAYDAFGYPAAAPFNGQTLKSCTGTATPDPYSQTQSQGIPCDMTGGSSGGPWFLDSGAQNSVNSFGYNNIPNVMFGPYYGSVAQATYTTAAAS